MPVSISSPRAFLRPALACIASAILAGCATGQHPRAPELRLPDAYDSRVSNTLSSEALDAWWSLYDDAQLRTLVEQSLASGLDARLALARLDEARAIRGQALSRYAPQGAIQGSVEHTRNHDLEDGPDPPGALLQGVSLPIRWEIDVLGRRSAARATADADLAAARFQYEAARAALAAQVARTLFEARGLAAQLDDARANERIQRALLDLLERRVGRGLSAASDADRVGAEVARSRAQRVALEAELQAARRSLLVLTGDGLSSVDTLVVGDTLSAPPNVPSGVPSDLLIRRPDVREARARIDSAGGAVRLAELDFFPTLTLQPAVGVSRQRGVVDTALSFWTLGAGMAIPVLDRPRLLAALDLQSARGEQAVIGYEQAVQVAFAETDQAFARLAASQQRVGLLQEGEARARRAFEAAEVRYRRGLGDLQGLLDAEAAWRATRTALTTARLDALLGSVQAFKALGGGWSVPTPPSRP